MTYYYVTWEEKKYRSCLEYIRCIPGHSVSHIRSIINAEQAERRRLGAPHMFHVKITKSRPGEDEIERRTRGHMYL